jgi:AraC-like DNA-binding protein
MLHYKNIHTSCFCYQKKNKQTISQKKFHRGESGSFILTSHHIVFVLNGSAECAIAGLSDTTVVVSSGNFIFLPTSTNMLCEALEDDTTVLLIRLSGLVGKLPECPTFRFQRLSGNLDTCPVENRGIYPLKMNRRILYLVKGIVTVQHDGIKCDNFAKHMVALLLTMIQAYYPQEEYMRFYSTITGSDAMFTDQVYERWMTCYTVGELANTFDMNIKQFTRYFNKVFGENPGSWLKKRRMEHIYHDICSSYKPLRQIAEEHCFLMTNFVRYCRNNFGYTPESIRRSLAVNGITPT